MIKFSKITNEILKLKINKVCLIELDGILPNSESLISLNEHHEIDGSPAIIIDGIEYNFK
jgi:hypothetical protein